jgi:hypothetical protein
MLEEARNERGGVNY